MRGVAASYHSGRSDGALVMGMLGAAVRASGDDELVQVADELRCSGGPIGFGHAEMTPSPRSDLRRWFSR